MARKKKQQEAKQGLADWMGTYADMVTLLLCFFILMFASAEVSTEKFDQIANSFKDTFFIKPEHTQGMLDALGNGIVVMPESLGESDKEFEDRAKEELEKVAENLKTYFGKNGLSDKIEIEQNDRYVILNFKDGLLFDSGSADIKPEAIPVLDVVAKEILKYPDNHIKIEGHTDNMPINTERFPNNWYLSAARAISVATHFIEKNGFKPDMVSTEGYGEYNPKMPNDTPENRSTNRRVEIKIMSKYYSDDYK